MTRAHKIFSSYIWRTVAIGALFLGAVLGLNTFFDPLWYFEDNLLLDRSVPFDERTSKSIRLLESPGAYDCMIFGGSRITLLNEADIAGHTCFNYSFSAGHVEEFLAFAEYARHLGVRPNLVIVELSGENFSTGPFAASRSTNVPGYITDKKAPPPFWISYVSVDILRFSLRRLFSRINAKRYYDHHFRGQATKGGREFRPQERTDAGSAITGYSTSSLSLYLRLRMVFPEASFIGLVPFVNAWEISDLENAGLLPEYLKTMHQASRIMDRFYDFGLPSRITRDPSQTYDGVHYYPESFAVVTGILGSTSPQDAPEFGLRVDQLDFAEYLNAYREAGLEPAG